MTKDDEPPEVEQEEQHFMYGGPEADHCGHPSPTGDEWCTLPPDHRVAQTKAGKPIHHIGRWTSWPGDEE